MTAPGGWEAPALLTVAARAVDLGDDVAPIAAGILGRHVDDATLVALADLADTVDLLAQLDGGTADPLSQLDDWSGPGAAEAARQLVERARDDALQALLTGGAR